MAVRGALWVILFTLVFRWIIEEFQSREQQEVNKRRQKIFSVVLVLAYIQTLKNNVLKEARSVSGI